MSDTKTQAPIVQVNLADVAKAIEALRVIQEVAVDLKRHNPFYSMALTGATGDILPVLEQIMSGYKAAQVLAKAKQHD